MHTARDGEEGLLQLGKHQPDIVLTDLNMPGLGGLGLLKIVRPKFPKVPVILTTGDGNEAVAAAALKNGAASYVAKDKSMGALMETIDRIVGASTSAHSFGRMATYEDRRIHVTADVTAKAVELVIRDEGPGFNDQDRFQSLGDNDATFAVTEGSRGLIMMQMFMDEVEFRGSGNEVRLLKRLSGREA